MAGTAELASGAAEGSVEGVSTDTRSGCAGMMFAALAGDEHDGHDYIADAVSGGASALLVARPRLEALGPLPAELPVFAAGDTLAALQKLASCWRDKVSPRVIGITGTAGKTETKEMTSAVLSKRFRVHSTAGNLNNHIGVPLTILSMPEDTDVLVVEMGANHKKEIKLLASIARPDVGVITNIGPGHLEFFGSIKGVASAKAELIEEFDERKTAILPADDEFLGFLREKTKAGVMTFGFSEGADFMISEVEKKEEGGYRFVLAGQQMESGSFGTHHLLNAAAACAAASVLGVQPEEAAGSIAECGAIDGRGVLYDIGGITFIDDSYNSNPSSLSSAVKALMDMPCEGKRWLVLGDMLELGGASGELHGEMGVMCGKAGVDGLLTLGTQTVELNRAAAVQRKAPGIISHFMEVATLAAYLDPFLSEGDIVLVKGSRGMAMEKVIEGIEGLRGLSRRRIV